MRPGELSQDLDPMKNKQRFAILLAGAVLAFHCAAADLRPDTIFLEAGQGKGSVDAVAVGAAWGWAWRSRTAYGQFTGATEAYVARWGAPEKTGRESFDLVAVLPVLRWRKDGGLSPWYVEGGIGLMYIDPRFRTASKEFTTNLNFADTLGFGRNFGERDQHELGLRLSHYSNAGLKRPNPGQNIVRLHYAYRF